MTSKRLSEAYARHYSRVVAEHALLYDARVSWYNRMMEADSGLLNVCWQEDGDGKPTGMAYVNVPESAGLRYVGRADVESYSGAVTYPNSNSRGVTGWYTSEDGVFSIDGDGLVWGVIYQLPGRSGYACCIAGYQIGGLDGGPVLDFSKIYYVDARMLAGKVVDGEMAKCSRAADKMAANVAEEEREYKLSQREKEDT